LVSHHKGGYLPINADVCYFDHPPVIWSLPPLSGDIRKAGPPTYFGSPAIIAGL
jgi:hypothetical protein